MIERRELVRVARQGATPVFAEARGEQLLVYSDAPWLAAARPTGEQLPLSDADLLAPVTPSKILCVGRNYGAHARELGNGIPEEPLWFFKPPSSLLASGGRVELPPESQQVDHEAELGVVIGRRARRIRDSEAADCVFGLLVTCDVTARDLQKKDGQWARAKGFDTFCPVSSRLVTGVDWQQLDISLRVNGTARQRGNTRDMVFGVPELIARASAFCTLEPGDVLLTGTPSGVGPLEPGDAVDVEIERVGSLRFGVTG